MAQGVGLALRAAAGASRAEMVLEAIQELRKESVADRIGVWLEDPGEGEASNAERAVFRGDVWEKAIGNAVLEWTRLPMGVPLRMDTLRSGLCCEYEIAEQRTVAVSGPELQLRRVVWAPVMVRRMLRGLVMAGTLEKRKVLSSAQVEKVATQLGLRLELGEERRLAAARKADQDFWLRMRRLVAGRHSVKRILGQLAESCTRGESMGGAGAVFALVGERKKGPAPNACGPGKVADHLSILAESGDSVWALAVNGGPLEALWRRAMEDRRAAVAEANALPLAKGVSRVVAIPILPGRGEPANDTAANDVAGVLVAGLPKQRATLETLERLEWRGALAAEIFQEDRWAKAEQREYEVQQKALVDSRGALRGEGTSAGVNVALEETLAAIGQNVTRIVHELNNPLTVILGNAERMLQREGPGSSPSEAVQILQEAERAAGIVRQLLDLPREATPEMRPLSLNEVVEGTLGRHKCSPDADNVLLKIELEEGLPPVKADRAQLQQMLRNLAQNAQQAMRDSGVGDSLLVRTSRAAPGWVRLEVQDNGPGVPEDLHARIFEPFFTTKLAGKGSGLGLAIVSGFVRQHGGRISVDSPAEGGARFVIELPEAREGSPALKMAAIRPVTAAPRETAAGEEKIPRVLVVEDEPSVATLIGDMLRDEGMEVDVVPDGEKAFEQTQYESYDLAICDMKMPGMDGQVFFEALEQAHSPLRQHLLFVTGDEVAPRTREFLARHHLPHVAKPFHVEELHLAVRTLLPAFRQSAGR